MRSQCLFVLEKDGRAYRKKDGERAREELESGEGEEEMMQTTGLLGGILKKKS